MTDQRTPHASETNDLNQRGFKSLSASILNAVSNALQIPSDSCVPTCRKSSGNYSALSIVVSSKPFTTELQLAAKKPWRPPVVEANPLSSKEC